MPPRASASQKRAKNAAAAQQRQPPEQAVPAPPPVEQADSMDTSSDSSDDDVSNVNTEGGVVHPSASRAGSPSNAEGVVEDSVTCQWGDCGVVFTVLDTLIDHIHSKCDKSFTRSDALIKHMRLQHNIEPPPTTRGGTSRKRKRGAEEAPQASSSAAPGAGTSAQHAGTSASAFNTFKVEASTPSENNGDDGEVGPTATANGKGKANGRSKRASRSQAARAANAAAAANAGRRRGDGKAGGVADEDGYESTVSDVLTPHLQANLDTTTGLVFGKTPAKAMYLVTKAKYEFALDQQRKLAEELRRHVRELRKHKEEKEFALNDLLKQMLGPEAEPIMMKFPPQDFVALDPTLAELEVDMQLESDNIPPPTNGVANSPYAVPSQNDRGASHAVVALEPASPYTFNNVTVAGNMAPPPTSGRGHGRHSSNGRMGSKGGLEETFRFRPALTPNGIAVRKGGA
ncbi:hypothetical protein CVT24_000944 [Panaeolus cyanescens]|uniref:C2H2-type domain-containing protein n=1 Tax=Panaeolus cyanescens TaxID=181874 RepID=A0A409YCK5_9AGAR|nr:hypothetical protein CVT24_000944 [Panaeolus cyanescens]